MTVFDVAHTFLAATGRLTLTPAEYQQLTLWDAAGIPATVVQRALADRQQRSKTPIKLNHCDPDVQEAYEIWRRAVGPRYA